MQVLQVPTGKICIIDGIHGKLERLSLSTPNRVIVDIL
jgi:hypothetical protein